ncbi:MAG: zinc-dependent metalloprotease [Micrococcus sp.]|nr:zinc-dependent metalloprotease [Micrococcus sp.]
MSTPARRTPIDWATAARTAATLAPAGPRLSVRQARQETDRLRAAAEASVGHVHRLTGLDAARDLTDSQLLIVDRPTWAQANTQAFEALLGPTFAHLEATWPQEFAAATTPVSSHAAGAETGAVLSWLSAKVLGQYEPFGSSSGSGGRLMLVAPNVVQVRQELNVDAADFRMWVCLHEQTHRVQFAAAPWLAGHLQQRITEFSTAMFDKSDTMMERLRGALRSLAPGESRGASDGPGGLLGILQDDEDRARLNHLTAVMSLLEGHANVIMDAVDADVVSSVKTIRRRFADRSRRRSALDQWIGRLLGMDAKLRQYKDGQKLVDAAVAELGMEGFNVVWQDPALLPTLEELHNPPAWVRRLRAA